MNLTREQIVARLDDVTPLSRNTDRGRCPVCNRHSLIVTEKENEVLWRCEGTPNAPRWDGCNPDLIERVLEQREPQAERSQEWEPIVPFGTQRLPPFPVEVLPEWLRAFVQAEAAQTQTPLDLSGMLVLAVASVAVATTHSIHIGAGGWTEPLNLFIAVALPPASRKSSVFASVTRVLQEYEQEENASRAPDIARSKTDRDILESRLEKAKAIAAKASEEDREQTQREAHELAERLQAYRTLVPRRFVADDCTQEKLASLLMEQGGRIAILSPEGGTFDIIGGRYTDKTPNMDIYLKGHAGDALRVDRVGRPAEYIANPALTLGLAIQPEVLQGLAARPGFRGRGLLGRFLFALPESNIGFRSVQSPAMPPDVRQAYERGIRELLTLRPAQDEEGNAYPHPLRLEPEALTLFKQWEAHIETALRPDGDLHTFADWGGKLCGATARLAGILHLAAYGETRCDVPVSIVGAAITLSKYLIAHAQTAYDVMGMDADIDNARFVLEWIRRKARQGEKQFKRREAHRELQSRFKRADQLDKPLAILCERNYIREELAPERAGAGRKPSPVFEIAPALTELTQLTE